ncbi:enoyl-CoA hydratase [Phreatobacter stygius]|uniref:Enoyl-CoA hydratase n=2 Tax=Pseudomonadota TaxID=1224 RepID=A0A4D7AXK5_9HYPH|nr:enoyl-CoA hydratase [Phreatobacter stygius]QCI64215.1 enoyl-CoA hydratase [Phreatobacter stygius]
MDQASIQYEAAGGIARLTIDQQAKMNAMTFDMWSSVPALIKRAEDDRSVRVIVLQGAGDKAFCAGADISQFGARRTGEDAVKAYDKAVAAGMAAVHDAAKPTVAVIRGICFGGGCALALTCDLRFATADSRFRVPAARLGLGYGFSNMRMMVNKLGIGPVADIMISARILDAADGQRLGVINRAWSREAFQAEVEAYLGTVAANAPLTLAAIKRSLIELSRPEAKQDPAAVDALIAKCFDSTDYKEGQKAFLEKRLPNFIGE